MEHDLTYIETSLRYSDLTVGLEYLQQLIHKYKSNHPSLKMILDRLYLISQSLLSQDSQAVLPLFQIQLKLCQILKDHSRLCDIKNTLSFIYRTSGKINLALKECLEALRIAKDHPNLAAKLPALHLNVCSIYREDIKDLEVAKTHAELAYYFSKEIEPKSDKQKKSLIITCYNYAVVLEELKDHQNSIEWLREGLKYCEKWEEFKMEQVFVEKINSLNGPDKLKNSKVHKRTVSQKPIYERMYNIGTERPTTDKRLSLRINLTPISKVSVRKGKVGRSTLCDGFGIENTTRKRNFWEGIGKDTKRHKLSLVQCVIKLQRWFRKMHGWEWIKLKNEYFLIVFKIIHGLKFFLCMTKRKSDEISDFLIEVWPLVKGTKRPKPVSVDIGKLCELFGKIIEEEHLRMFSFQLSHIIQVTNNMIRLKKIKEIYEGYSVINGYDFKITIIFVERTLEIQASSDKEKLFCSVKLDALHSIKEIKSKIGIVLENLTIKSGKLVFNLV